MIAKVFLLSYFSHQEQEVHKHCVSFVEILKITEYKIETIIILKKHAITIQSNRKKWGRRAIYLGRGNFELELKRKKESNAEASTSEITIINLVTFESIQSQAWDKEKGTGISFDCLDYMYLPKFIIFHQILINNIKIMRTCRL